MIDDSDTPLTYSSYDEISQRPRFIHEIDITKSQIEKLIASYSFPEKHPCGKKGCHQPHNNGWLAVTTNNQETLIGSKCGIEWGGNNQALPILHFKKPPVQPYFLALYWAEIEQHFCPSRLLSLIL